MESLIRDGHVTRGWIGVEPRDLVPDMAQALNVRAQEGVLITAVLQGGPANKAGIKPGDVITGVGGRDIANTQELLSTVAALKPRSEVPVRVERGRQQLTLKVVVAERPRVTPGDEQQNTEPGDAQGDDQGDDPDDQGGDPGGDQGDGGSADGGSSGPQ
jgi:S1-C subfamily serine protease